MQKITPHIWFDKEAEEAASFYTSIFSGGKILNTVHYPEVGQEVHGMTAGAVMTVDFEIEGQNFIALNGGPAFKLNPSISFTVVLPTAEKVNELWEKLLVDGSELMPLGEYPFSKHYGWLSDRYGVSWQLIVAEEGAMVGVVPFLMFCGDNYGRAEEAIDFYTSIFPDSNVGEIYRYDSGPATGKIAHANLSLYGERFQVSDSMGEHSFNFNEGVSLLVKCENQDEIDDLWKNLSAVPEAEQCGWLKDKFGVSWQIVPTGMDEILNSPDREKANRAMEAMLQMKKIDIDELRDVYEGQ